MLRLLLDEHLPPALAEQMNMRRPEIPVISIHDWRGGSLCGRPDSEVLVAARTEELTLVSFDQRSIKPLLVEWGNESIPHAGVIFVSQKTYFSHDVGGLLRALCELWDETGDQDWMNRTMHLR